MHGSTRRSPRSPTRRGGRSSPASSRGEASVTELAEPFAMTQPAISKHLKVLEKAGLVSRRRDAQRRPCRLEADALRQATEWLDAYRRHWAERYERLDDLLDELQPDDAPRKDPSHEPDRRPSTSSRSATGRSASCGRSGRRASSCSTPTPSPSCCGAGWARPTWTLTECVDRPPPGRHVPPRDGRTRRRQHGDARRVPRGRPAVAHRRDGVVRRRLDGRRDREHDDVRRGRRHHDGDRHRRVRVGRVTRRGAGDGDGGRAWRRASTASTPSLRRRRRRRRHRRPLPPARRPLRGARRGRRRRPTGTTRRRAPSGGRATSSATSSTCTA